MAGQNASTGTAGGLKKTDALPNEYITGFVVATGHAYLGGYGQGDDRVFWPAKIRLLDSWPGRREIAMLPGGACRRQAWRKPNVKGEQTLTGDGNGPPPVMIG